MKKASEQRAGSGEGGRMFVLNQSMKMVLLVYASVRAETGYESPNAQRVRGDGSTNGVRPSWTGLVSVGIEAEERGRMRTGGVICEERITD